MSKVIYNLVSLLSVAPVSAKANLREQVKRSGRSQNRRLQKGLPV